MRSQDDSAPPPGVTSRSSASTIDDHPGAEVREASPPRSPDRSPDRREPSRRGDEPQASAPRVTSGTFEFEPKSCASRACASRDWRTLFAADGADAVLRRIVEGDPLGVRVVVSERLREECLFADGERVTTRALARIARFAQAYRGRPTFSKWLRARCEEAIDDILDEDREALRNPDTPPSPALVALAQPLGLDPAHMRAACASFNDLPRVERTAFFAVVLARTSIDACAQREGITNRAAAQRARRALEAVLCPQVSRNEEELP